MFKQQPDQNTKNMFLTNADFYPTPTNLIAKMWAKVDSKEISCILEPSAGSGTIVDFLKNYRVKCIEKDHHLRAILMGKSCDVIDCDFLKYSGYDGIDVIIMNPPFSEGEHHLLKAIDILFSGQIVCILNAQTLKNPCTNYRKVLVQKLEELGADIEYIQDAFSFADRPTDVEVALIYIDKRIDIDTFLFDGVERAKPQQESLKDQTVLMSGSPMLAMVEGYNHTISCGVEVLKKYFQEYNYISSYLFIDSTDGRHTHYSNHKTLNQRLNTALNEFLVAVRKSYWTKALKLPEFRDRLTEKKLQEFHALLEKQEVFDFTEENIRQFLQNLISGYEDILTEATAEIFNKMTQKHH